jgi:secondary thiamine-phosphate synthase enzyme
MLSSSARRLCASRLVVANALRNTTAAVTTQSEMTMKSFTKVFEIATEKRVEFRNITPTVEAALKESGVKEGIVLVNTMHTSSSVFVDDDDPLLHKDLEAFVSRVAPWDPESMYFHNVNGETNGAAHLQRAVLGREVVCAITDGKLHLGKVRKESR